MKIAVTQMNILWEDKKANMNTCIRMIKKASEKNAKLIIFPEMTLTGFTMNTEYAGECDMENGESIRFFKEMSVKYEIAIIFGMVYTDKNNVSYNKSIMVSEGNVIMDYSKLHPFSYGNETRYYGKGENITWTVWNNIKVSSFICYDLRFPEIFQIASEKSQLITVIANWPDTRTYQWDALLKARAIENQAYIAGVNRVGESEGLKYEYSSVIYDPYGKRITKELHDEIIYADIDIENVYKYRKEFPVKDDRRRLLYREYM